MSPARSYVRPGDPVTTPAGRRFGMSTKRKLVLAAVIWAALAAVPPPSDADTRAMTDEEIAALTCGHLGVPCPAPDRAHRRCHSASRAHTRRAKRARARAAQCRTAQRRRAAKARRRA
jgi:hypothetical protein